MFTGLVEAIGTVVSVEKIDEADLNTCRLTIATPGVSKGAEIGDSVAINGCCLTVVAIDDERLAFDAGSETLSRTNLGRLRRGSPVNLERAMLPTDRLGGHFVSGHVDAVGTIAEIRHDDAWAEFWFSVGPEMTVQMVEKGSVAVDGISLTLVHVQEDRFSIALIPHTLEVTTLGKRSVGDKVNIETDVLAKMVQKQVAVLAQAGKLVVQPNP